MGKARSLPQRGVPERGFTWVGSWPYPQTLDEAGKACQGQQAYYGYPEITAVISFRIQAPGPYAQ